MPGLLGGGGGDQPNGAPVNIPITSMAPPWNMQDTMAPAEQPGQIEMLAQNLANGGFGGSGGSGGLEQWLRSFYKPARTSVYAPPVAPTAAPPGAPAAVAKSGVPAMPAKRKTPVSSGRGTK